MAAGFDVEIELLDEGNGVKNVAKNAALNRLKSIVYDIVEKKMELTSERAGAALELARAAKVLDQIPENVMHILRMVSGEMSMQSSSEEEAAAKAQEREQQKVADEASLKCMLCDKNDRNMIMLCCQGCVEHWEATCSQHGGNLRLLRIICTPCTSKTEKNYRKFVAAMRHARKPKEEVDTQMAKNFSCPQCKGPLRGRTDIFLNEKKLGQAHMVLGWTECIGCGAGLTPETMGQHVLLCEKVYSARDEGTANYIKDATALSLRHCDALMKERDRHRTEEITNYAKNTEAYVKEHNEAITAVHRTSFRKVTTDKYTHKRTADMYTNYGAQTQPHGQAGIKRVRRTAPPRPSSTPSPFATSKQF